MLIGVFELLADARIQVASVNAYLDSLRDYWLAQCDLDMALIGKVELQSPTNSPSPTSQALSPSH
jgi:hypothetical protein